MSRKLLVGRFQNRGTCRQQSSNTRCWRNVSSINLDRQVTIVDTFTSREICNCLILVARDATYDKLGTNDDKGKYPKVMQSDCNKPKIEEMAVTDIGEVHSKNIIDILDTILEGQQEKDKEAVDDGIEHEQQFPTSLLSSYNWALDQAEDRLETVMLAPHPDFKKKSSKILSCVGTVQRTLELGYRFGMGMMHNFIISRQSKTKEEKHL